MLQREIGIHPLETVVFMVQLLQPLHVRGFEPAVRGFPLVVGRGADAVLPPQLVDRAPGIASFKIEAISVSVNLDWRTQACRYGGHSTGKFSFMSVVL